MAESLVIDDREGLAPQAPAPAPASPERLIGAATRAAVTSLQGAKALGVKDPALTRALLGAAEKLSAVAALRLAKSDAPTPAPETGETHRRVSDPMELIAALRNRAITEIELPFSILDHRWRRADVRAALKAREGVTIHVYGAFMGNLLSARAAEDWPVAEGADAQFILDTLDHLARATHRQSRADLCLAYVRAQGWIDGVLVNPADAEEWDSYTRLAVKAPLTPAECALVEDMLPRLPEALLNPNLWA